MYDTIARKLAAGRTIILDGGTGTDIQARGVPMSGETWCAEANISHPHVVKAVHEDYIRAGAEIIIANTFATSALLFNALDRDDDLLVIDRQAVSIAREAAEGKDVAVAGSISTMRPVTPGSDRTSRRREWPEAEARRLLQRKADHLAECGVDLLMMEMMRDTDYSVWATEAAVATGLPVWAGLSAERRGDGSLSGFGREDQDFEAAAQAIAATGPDVVTVMHTSPNDTGAALDIVRKSWDGPLGAYPESGYFTMPDWQFVDVISPKALVDLAADWRRRGVTILGGCCGIGPAHIAALSKAFRP